MEINFSKMHGLGNDFMVIDGINQKFTLTPEHIRQLADRHLGIGFDQLLLVEAADRAEVDFRYRIFNADGGEVAQCGNGARCFAKFVNDKSLINKDIILVSTNAGVLELKLQDNGLVAVNMGIPVLTPENIPFQAKTQSSSYNVVVDGKDITLSAVSMGNPHAVVEVDDISLAPVSTLGPALEAHERFPQRVNVGFMQIVDRSHIRLRVYERGAGETQACGSGACAAVVAGRLLEKLDDQVSVELTGGELEIHWQGPGYELIMTGPAVTVYEGQVKV